MVRLVGDIIAGHPHLAGLYNLASEVVSKFELLCLARDAFGLDIEIEPDDTFVCRRDLDGSRLRRALGTAPPSWREMMAGLAADATPYDRWRK
jgi:dTDP-4-dehydrorhamnose reductase